MRSNFGTIKTAHCGSILAEYRRQGVSYSRTFATRDEAVEWLRTEQTATAERNKHRTPYTKLNLTPPEQGGTAHSNLFNTGVKVSTAAVGNSTDIIVIIPPALSAERQRIADVIGEYICPTWHHVRVSEGVSIVTAICGHGILPHEQRTLWDVLTAAADRRGFHLCTNGKLTKTCDEIDAQAHNLRTWTTAYEEAS